MHSVSFTILPTPPNADHILHSFCQLHSMQSISSSFKPISLNAEHILCNIQNPTECRAHALQSCRLHRMQTISFTLSANSTQCGAYPLHSSQSDSVQNISFAILPTTLNAERILYNL